MGRSQHPILVEPDAVPAEHFDAVITESTYGDRIHETPSDVFAQIITKTIARGGSVLIPAFAVDRTEVILIELRKLMDAGGIPRVPVYVDSPMALSSLEFYRDAIEAGDAEIRKDVSVEWRGKDIFDSGTLHEMRTVEESKSLNNVRGPHIIVSASGMATGGRVVHHLARMLPEPKNTVLLVGFQAAGTRGRLLEQGDTEVKIHGDWIPVQAQIAKAESFSVHADGVELGQWLGRAQNPTQVFVVHGETGAAQTFATHLNDKYGWDVVVPTSEQRFMLSSPTSAER
jgi:metallo-beta-lactamase family protein